MRKCSGALDIYIIVGLSALLVSTNRAMRRPQDVKRVTDWLHAFFVYVRILNFTKPFTVVATTTLLDLENE